MGANLNFKQSTLGVTLGGSYYKIKLEMDANYFYLPIESKPYQKNHYTATASSSQNDSSDISDGFYSLCNKRAMISTTGESSEVINLCNNSTQISNQDCYSLDNGNFKHESVKNHARNNGISSDKQLVSIPPNSPPLMTISNLRKLHVQLKHGTKSEMEEWLRRTSKWNSSISNKIDNTFILRMHDGTKSAPSSFGQYTRAKAT